MFKKIFIFMLLIFIIPTHSFANYYAEKYFHDLYEKPETVKYPAIFVHGIRGGFQDWDRTINTLSGGKCYEMRYFDNEKIFHTYYGQPTEHWFWNVSYYSPDVIGESMGGNLKLYAERLDAMIEVIKQITGQKKVILIAHSMGGLVARQYMASDKKHWDSVYKILTVGSPHQGVITSPTIVGQLIDLHSDSEFLKNLKVTWEKQTGKYCDKWGVIGAVDNNIDTNSITADSTDSAGPGFITISSAIPFDEWKSAIGTGLQKAAEHTEHFGFRLATRSNHLGLLYNDDTFKGIEWALRQAQ